MSGITNTTGAVSGVIGTTVGTPPESVAGTGYFLAKNVGGSWGAHAIAYKIPFNTEVVDDDGNYDPSTYQYTAPATGVYYFGASLYTAQTDSDNGFIFFIDDTLITYSNSSTYLSYMIASDTDWCFSCSITLKLNASQTVDVRTATQSDLYIPNSCWWGYRLK